MSNDSKELPTLCTCQSGDVHEPGCPRAAPQSGMRAEGEAGTILQIGGAGHGAGWGLNAIEVRECTGGNGWKWRPITAVENQWLIDALNTFSAASPAAPSSPALRAVPSASPPSIARTRSDSASLNDSLDILSEISERARKMNIGLVEYPAEDVERVVAVLSAGKAPGPTLSTAPPKPAPDAMREALIRAQDVIRRYFRQERPATLRTSANQVLHEIKAALSAPVPPPDGVADATVSEPVVRDTNMFSRLANEPLAVIPEGYSAPLDIRTAAEIQHDRLAAKALPQHVGREATVSARDAVIEEVWQHFNGFVDDHMLTIEDIKDAIRSLIQGAKP